MNVVLFLKKKKVFFILFHIKKKKNRFDFLKLSTNLDLFIYKIDLIFFTYKPKTNFFIVLFYFVSKHILFFYIQIKNQFFYSQKWFLNFFFFNKEKDAFINKFMWLSLVKCFTYATYHSYHA